MDELLPLLDATVSVASIAEGKGVKPALVTYELVPMRQAGLPVPVRLKGFERFSGTIAIEDDLRAGMSIADVARKHGVTAPKVSGIRSQAGIPTDVARWTEVERRLIITHQDRSAREVVTLLGRTVRAVSAQRSLLIAEGLVRPKK